MFKRSHLQAAASALAMFAFAGGSAKAAIVEHGTYIADTKSNLDWLNLTILNGYSYEQVVAGALGYTTTGWRYANQSELIGLFSTYVGAQNGQYEVPTSAQTSSYVSSA